jgi:hypothetical protein
VRREVRRRTHNGESLVARHTHGDHIALNRLAEVNAGIEVGRDELCASLLRGGDLEDDVREPTTKFEQLRREYHRGRHRRHQQAHAPRGLFTPFDDLLEDRLHLAQGRPKTTMS